jgi:hypothetical protein
MSLTLGDDATERVIKGADGMWLTHLLRDEIENVTYRDCIIVDKYIAPELSKLEMTDDARRSLSTANAGGRSIMSEMLSIHYFCKVHKATNIILEKEVEYWIDYKMVDYVCTINDARVGVSVTRAMGFPTPKRFTPSIARHLLEKKLYGLIVSRDGVTDRHNFYKSVLHVWCQTAEIAQMLVDAYRDFDIKDYGLDVKGTLILILTICEDEGIYSRDRHVIEPISKN